jgi:O-antigen/teichoic acid export membrane protein
MRPVPAHRRQLGGLLRRLLTAPVRRVARNSAWTLAATAIAGLALFAETILLARNLSPERLGVYFLIIAYPEAVQELLDFRVRDAMTRYLGRFLAQERKPEAVAVLKLLWRVDVVVATVALAIVAVTAPFVAGLLVDDPDAPKLMIFYAVGLWFSSLDTASGPILRVLDRYALSFLAGTFKALLRVGAIALVILNEGELEELVLARVAVEVLATLVLGGMSLYALGRVVRGHWGASTALLREQRREIRGFLVHTNIAGILRMAAVKLDKLLVGALTTPANVGLYKVATQFGSAPLLVTDALDTVTYPTFAKAYPTERRREIREIAVRMTALLSVFAVPVAVILAIEAEEVAELIGGESFRAAGPALAICLLAIVPHMLLFWQRSIILTAGHAAAQVRILSVVTVVQLGTLVALVPLWGATGAAVSFGLRHLGTSFLQALFIRRHRLLDP